MKFIKAIFVLSITAALSSCNLWGDGLVEKLCDEEAKYTTGEHFPADGVTIEESYEYRNYVGFDAPILFNFTGLKYIEISTKRPENLVKESIETLGEEGYKKLSSKPYLRVYLARSGSAECIYWQGLLTDNWQSEQLSRHNWCLAAKPIDRPSAKYRARAESLKEIRRVKSIRFTITEIGKDEPISEAINFYYTAGAGKNRATSQCWGYGKYFKGKDFSIFGLLVETFKNPESETYHFMKPN